MATVTTGYTFVNNETVTPAKLNSLAGGASVSSIVNADIDAAAAIADTKLATIATAGKISNSATTATNANTASAIVARDASGNFSAGTITATTVTGSGNSSFAGNVGIGTSSPSAKLSVYGAGQTAAAISTTSSLGGSAYVQDSGGASGNGGAIILGAQQGAFTAIKALITDGTVNTTGDLAFSTRNVNSDATLTERLRITATGTINAQGNPITNCLTTTKAWGGGSSTGVIEALTFGVSTITRTSLGNYLITMTTAINGYDVVTSPNSAVGNQATAQVVSTTQFRVYTFGGGGAAGDGAFKFVVFGV